MKMKALVTAGILMSALGCGVGMANITAIHFWNNDNDSDAVVRINGVQTIVPKGGATATPVSTTSPTFTIEYNPGASGDVKFTCTIFDGGSNIHDKTTEYPKGAPWISGTTANVDINPNVQLYQTDISTENPNNNSISLIQSATQYVPSPMPPLGSPVKCSPMPLK